MLNVPTPLTAGSNVPVAALVIPGPTQVPPGVTPERVAAAPFKQNGPAGLIDASGVVLIVMD